jgi:hypothetical protein
MWILKYLGLIMHRFIAKRAWCIFMGLGSESQPTQLSTTFHCSFLSLPGPCSLSLRKNGVESVQNTNPIVEFTITGQEPQPHQRPNQPTHRQMDAGTV